LDSGLIVDAAPGEKVYTGLEAVGLTFETDSLPQIQVTLRWIRRPKVPQNKEIEETIDEAFSQGIEITETNQILRCDPRLCISRFS
jgi:hypothetical protein